MINYLINLLISQMSTPLPNSSKNLEYIQDDKTYRIKYYSNLDKFYLSIRNISKIESFYELEISLDDIKKKNQIFKMYQTVQEFTKAFEEFIKSKNISINESQENLTFNLIVFNIFNGSKENVSFALHKKENDNKDEIIKYLCTKVNNLEAKLDEMNKNYINLKTIVDGIIKEQNEYNFVWESHSNCQLSNGGKRIKKIQNNGWNTGVKGNKILKRNEVNIFKIIVNHVNSDKSGLQFGISKYNSNVSKCGIDWHMRCDDTSDYKYKSFSREKIYERDTITFIADLKNGTLEVKKNTISLGKLNDLPTNEDLIPSASIYYVNDEIEIID
jgi:hypothetical protein